MKIASMERDADEMSTASPREYKPPKYNSSLCLYLSDEDCEKLGIDRALPPGTVVKIEANAIVTSATEHLEGPNDEGEDPNGNDVSLSVQIVEMGVEPVGSAKNAADILYG